MGSSRRTERIQLALDYRQIFLLFVASAVVVSLVFALGVVVGKRIAPQVAEEPPTDPLALLDRMGAQQPEDLSFSESLLSGHKQAERVGKADDKATPSVPGRPGGTLSGRGTPVAGSAARAAATPAPAAKASPPAAKASPPKPATAASVTGADEDGMARAETAAERAEQQKADQLRADRVRAAAKLVQASKPAAAVDAPLAKPKATAKPKQAVAPKSPAGAYTLQLSSFQDRREAEEYMARLRDSGFVPHMVPARIPGRGLWYRIRLGDYADWDAATAAKNEFERKHQIIAYVAKR